MSITRSKLQEVLDQLSLNVATGKHLNTISGNYGLHRPIMGFDDHLWRAITKVLAVQYRQIANKFRDILELLYGPQRTFATNLTEFHPKGTTVLKVHDVGRIPDVGYVVLDKGRLIEETLRYILVSRQSNLMYLETATAFDHKETQQDTEQILLDAHPGYSFLSVLNVSTFPTSGFPYPLLLGRGTAEEETVLLTGADVPAGTINITSPKLDHFLPPLLPTHTYTARKYSTSSFVLLVDNAAMLPPSGVLWLLKKPVEYTRRSVEEHAIYLKYTLPFSVPQDTLVEVLENSSTVALGTVQVLGAGWDVIQATPYLVELLLPYIIMMSQDPRTASYIHPDFGTYTGTLSMPAEQGDKLIETSDIRAWPKAGTVKIGTGDYVGYSAHDQDSSLRIPFGLPHTQAFGTAISYYSPVHTTVLESGDINALYAFPGPYVFDPNVHGPKAAAPTQLVDYLSKPTQLALDVKAGAGPKVLEVVDASFFPSSGSFEVTVGGERFTAIERVTLHTFNPVSTTVNGNHAAGATSLTLVTTSHLPDGNGFRLLLGGSDSEIVFVKSWTGNVLTLEAGLQYAKASGSSAIIASDCVVVTQVDSNHHGLVLYQERTPIVAAGTKSPLGYVSNFDYSAAEVVTPQYANIALVDASSFATGPGTAIISYGFDTTEELAYSSRSGNILHFDTSPDIQFNHYNGEDVGFSDSLSEPAVDGSDYPLRMPVDDFESLRYLIDLVRAAGIEVNLISQR